MVAGDVLVLLKLAFLTLVCFFRLEDTGFVYPCPSGDPSKIRKTMKRLCQ